MHAERRHRVPLGRTLLIGFLAALLTLAGNVLAAFVTEWSQDLAWFATPAVGVVTSMVIAVFHAYAAPQPGSARPGSTQPASGPPGAEWPSGGPAPATYRERAGQPPDRRRRNGQPIAVALVAISVLGLGAWGVTTGVRAVVGQITGDEPGVDQLVRPAGGSLGPVSVTVLSVQRTDHFTRIEVEVANGGEQAVSLPLFGNCTLSGGGTTLAAEPFKSEFPATVPAGATGHRGHITFDGHLPPGTTEATLSFATVFGGFLTGSLVVMGLPLQTAG